MYVIAAFIIFIVGCALLADWLAGDLSKRKHEDWLRVPTIEEYARKTQLSRIQCWHCKPTKPGCTGGFGPMGN